jgi:hypothetical protein
MCLQPYLYLKLNVNIQTFIILIRLKREEQILFYPNKHNSYS